MKRWAVPAAIIVAIEYAAALTLGWRIGFHYSIPFAAYLISGITVAAIGFSVGIVFKLVRYSREREAHPTSRLLAELRDLAPFAVGVVLVALTMGVLGWMKSMLGIATGYWADPLLIDADRLLLGTDGWRLIHANDLIDRIYITLVPLKFAVLLVLVCLPETRNKAQALLSYFLIVFAGAIGQYALPSAGPLFHQPVPLRPWVSEARDYLWQAYITGQGRVGSGISAMPSIHVALALWIALVVRSYQPKLGALGIVYFVLIFVGSVALGWHYAVDGIAGAAVALFAWRVVSAEGWTAVRRLEPVFERQVQSG